MYCVYIDSLEKIHQLVRTLTSHKDVCADQLHSITSMYLTISGKTIHYNGCWNPHSEGDLSDHDLTAITALFNHLSPSLTRLLLQLPSALTKSQEDLRKGFSSWDDHQGLHLFQPSKPNAIDQAYFTAFQSLVHLEVLVNLGDTFDALNTTQAIWLFFPKLRVLGMNELPDYWRLLDFVWQEWISLKRLETVIFIESGLNEECTFEEVWDREADTTRVFNVVTVWTADQIFDEYAQDVWRSNGNLRFRDVAIEMEYFSGMTRKDVEKLETPVKWVMKRLLSGEECITS